MRFYHAVAGRLFGVLFVLGCCGQSVSAAEWQFTDLSGQLHLQSQYRGKWVLVNYWAPWCPPCLQEMPELVAFYDAHATQVMVLGVAVQYTSVKSVQAYANDMLISYPIILGDAKKNSYSLPRCYPPLIYTNLMAVCFRSGAAQSASFGSKSCCN